MTVTHSQQFSTPPSPWRFYPRILASRKPALVAEGAEVPRLEARLSRVRVDAAHLARYREVCGEAVAVGLPIAYPHVLAGALHLAMLGSRSFPVAIPGLVHVANRIEQFGQLEPAGGGELSSWLQGHERTARGQEFVLHTEWRRAGELLWREASRFLARAPRPTRDARPKPAPRPAAEDAADPPGLPVEVEPSRAAVATVCDFDAPAGLGRRYAQVSGDVNPIHLADLAARAFGFRAAIAHGMWSLARCATALDAFVPPTAPRVLEVQFRQPVFLPARLRLRSTADDGGASFALRDAESGRIHLGGTLRHVA